MHKKDSTTLNLWNKENFLSVNKGQRKLYKSKSLIEIRHLEIKYRNAFNKAKN